MPDDPDVVIEQPINSNKLSPDEADAYFEKIDMEEAEVRQLPPRIRLHNCGSHKKNRALTFVAMSNCVYDVVCSRYSNTT